MDRDTLLRFMTTGWDYVFIQEAAGRAEARRVQCLGNYLARLCVSRRVTVDFQPSTVDFLEAHDVIAAIDVDGFASDAGAAVGKQKRGGRAHFRGFNVALQGRPLYLGFQHVAKI
jgi:hypothetical protein